MTAIKTLNTNCPYCAKSYSHKVIKTEMFLSQCTSCCCEFGVDALYPDFVCTFKIPGLPEKTKLKVKSLKK